MAVVSFKVIVWRGRNARDKIQFTSFLLSDCVKFKISNCVKSKPHPSQAGCVKALSYMCVHMCPSTTTGRGWKKTLQVIIPHFVVPSSSSGKLRLLTSLPFSSDAPHRSTPTWSPRSLPHFTSHRNLRFTQAEITVTMTLCSVPLLHLRRPMKQHSIHRNINFGTTNHCSSDPLSCARAFRVIEPDFNTHLHKRRPSLFPRAF